MDSTVSVTRRNLWLGYWVKTIKTEPWPGFIFGPCSPVCPTWHSVAGQGRGAPLAGGGRGGGPVVLPGLTQGHLRVHLVVLIIPEPRAPRAPVVLMVGQARRLVLPGYKVQGLAVWPDVLHLPDGLGGGGHVVGHVLLLCPGHQGGLPVSALVAELTRVWRHLPAVAIGHHLVSAACSAPRAGVAPLTQIVTPPCSPAWGYITHYTLHST